MKVSISWLNEWIEVTDLDPKQLAERLTMAGLEVDGIEYPGHGHDDIVVGKILGIEDHPKADRLVVCRVDTGDDQERTIVCGAKNMKAGDRVPVALPGSAPPGIDFEIGAREVMGVQSAGMLCSREELELAEESEGLMILSEELELGTPIFDALEMRDVVLEIDLTPNRSDCLSHLGVAREVAALYGRSLREERLSIEKISAQGAPVSDVAGLVIEDLEGCPQYRLAVLEGVSVGPSPAGLRRRLLSVGQRSVNNIVDVTNFVLLDVGQPLHAFDLDLLEENRIVVRRAKSGEKLEAIDHNCYALSEADLVIADASRPVALAGVMGGSETEVSETTTRILLECAYFDPTTVRKSSKRHGIHSESSHRYERGIDSGALKQNLERAVALLFRAQDTDPVLRSGELAEGSAPTTLGEVTLDVDRTARVLGIELDADDCRSYLEEIGLQNVGSEEGGLRFAIPTYRPDLERPIDLVEEIARLHGYDRIPARMPRFAVGEGHKKRTPHEGRETKETILSRGERRVLDWVRGFLLDQGLMEAVNYSFMGRDDLDRLGLAEDDDRRDAAEVANPLVKSQALMRTTLVAGLLDNLQTNLAQRRQDVALFEVGRRYLSSGEARTLGIVVTGAKGRHWSGDRSWDFFDLKGVVQALATPFAIDDASWQRPQSPEPYLHPGVQARWLGDGVPLGVVGQLHPAQAQQEGIEAPVFFAEIDLEALIRAGRRESQMQEASKYPAVIRDFALLYEQDRPYKELEDAIAELARDRDPFGSIFEKVELFDVYEGEQVPQGQRSLAIKITYRSESRTLKESEIEVADRHLLSYLDEKIGARLR